MNNYKFWNDTGSERKHTLYSLQHLPKALVDMMQGPWYANYLLPMVENKGDRKPAHSNSIEDSFKNGSPSSSCVPSTSSQCLSSRVVRHLVIFSLKEDWDLPFKCTRNVPLSCGHKPQVIDRSTSHGIYLEEIFMHAGCPEARPAYVLGSWVKEVLFKAKRQWLRSSSGFFFLISQTGGLNPGPCTC